MESAFGVDHGDYEIEKFSLAGGVTRLGQKAVGAGNQLRRAGAANVRSSKSFALSPGSQRNRSMMGGAQMKMGGALKKVGGFAQRNPGAVGVGAAGAGAAGVGGAAGLYANRRRF